MCTKFNPSIMENLMSNFWRLWFSNSFKSIERRFCCCWINYWKLLYQFCVRWSGRSIRVGGRSKNRFIILFIHKRKNGDRHDCDTVNFSYFRWKIVHDYREKSGVFFIVFIVVCLHTYTSHLFPFLSLKKVIYLFTVEYNWFLTNLKRVVVHRQIKKSSH